MHIAEQNTTDFEKAIYSINADIYLCFGFWGDEIDHSLGNFHLLHKYFHKKIILFSEKSCMFALPKNGNLIISPGNIFSVYPLEKTKFISSVGLQYPLDNFILEPGKTIGIRNTTSSSSVSWNIEVGKNVGIITSDLRNTIISFFLKQ